MRMIVNPMWAKEMKEALTEESPIDETIRANISASFLIVLLSKVNRPFKVYNLGAGVKRVTTDTDACPCCKKKLN